MLMMVRVMMSVMMMMLFRSDQGGSQGKGRHHGRSLGSALLSLFRIPHHHCGMRDNAPNKIYLARNRAFMLDFVTTSILKENNSFYK